MENLDSFFEVLPYADSHDSERFAPFHAARQSWAELGTLSRDANWIYGNFSDSHDGSLENNSTSRIAIRSIIFSQLSVGDDGREIYFFTHS